MVREPVVAGAFYEARPESLSATVKRLLEPKNHHATCMAVIAPHAGYMYSGKSAGAAYAAVKIPKHVIVLGPNHTGLGARISVMNEGTWKTPIGDMQVNSDIAGRIISSMHLLPDFMAHMREHSIEVQLPFIITENPKCDLVPVCLAEPEPERLKKLAFALAQIVRDTGALLVCSTDLTHYEPDETAKQKDSFVLQAIEAVDAEQLLSVVQEHDISMCGWMPAYVTLLACKELGAQRGKIISYTTSADAGGDPESVVGYCGAVII